MSKRFTHGFLEDKKVGVKDVGVFLRHLRIDADEVLGEMAANLNMSPSYLSAIENGKRDLPEGFCDLVIQKYKLEGNKAKKLKQLEVETRKKIIIPMDATLSERQMDTALMFAKDFSKLNDNQLNNIIAVLRGST